MTAKPFLSLCLDPGGDESVRAIWLGGWHGGVQLGLLRPACHTPAAGLGLLPAGGQRDELCALLVQGGDNVLQLLLQVLQIVWLYTDI